MRRKININKSWKFVKENVGLDNVLNSKAKKVNLPHTWNNLDGQDGGADYYRGICWYYKKLNKLELSPDEVAYIEFEGAHSICDVYLNGHLLTHHEGGFSTFRANMTDFLSDENILVVSVDNRANDYVYPQMADFTFFGGIYRNVNLILTNIAHFDLDYHGGSGVQVTPVIEGNDATVRVDCYLTNCNSYKIHAVVEGSDGNIAFDDNYSTSSFEIKLNNVHLWNGVKDPYLYTLKLELVENNCVVDNQEVKFGCRTFRIDPNEGFFLNGKSYPLRGVSRHQDRYNMGWAITPKEHEEDMILIKELGATTIRLAHYQHDQYFYDLCDQNGMVIWAEIPYISSDLAKGHNNALSQMKELVTQNYNHPSIVVWGLSNEITISGETPELVARHRELNELVHSMDKTRLTTMAQVSMLDTNSELNHISDVISYNHYFGWYGGDVEDNAVWLDKFHKENPYICLGISEYGCEAILSWHNSKPDMGDYSEEYQSYYHYRMLETFKTRPYLWATHVWNMFDFAADARDEGGCKGRNNKGLVTYDRKIKKDSYFLYQSYWSTTPMLHLAKKRYIYRNDEVTEVLVYSNQKQVSLYVNGKLFETQNGEHVFKFMVPLTKKTTKLVALSGSLMDRSLVKKVNKPYQKYILNSGGDAGTNWFTADGKPANMTFDPQYFSIKDKIKDILANPEGKAVIDGLMEGMSKTVSERGFTLSEGMMKMISGFSIERISKMAGEAISTEQIVQLNEALQKVKKQVK